MKKLFIYLIFLIIRTTNMQAQVVAVYDKATMQPAFPVAVSATNRNEIINVMENGMADISVFKNHETIMFSSPAFETYITSYSEIAKNNFKIFLTEKIVRLEEVIISSSRFDEKKTDVSRQVEVISYKEIQLLNAQTSADVLEKSGEVFVQKSQLGGGSPVLRGFEANKVLMVIDGVRMNNAIYRGGHLQNAITIDNSMLERIELLFGSGTVIYGSDALGGVVNFISKKPKTSIDENKPSIFGDAFTRYATAHQEFTGHAGFNVGFKKMAFLTSVTWSQFGDLRQGNIRNPFYGDWGKRKYYQVRINGVDTMIKNSNVNVQKKTGYTQYDAMQKILFKQSEKVSHLLNLQYSNSSDVPRYDRLTEVDDKGIFKNAEWYYGPQQRMMAAYTLSFENMSKLFDKSNITLAYQTIEESRHNRAWQGENLTHRTENVKVYTTNADFEKRFGKNELQYGIEFGYNDVQSEAERENVNTGEIKTQSTRYPDGGSHVTTMAAYAQHHFHLNEKIIFNEGIRFTGYALESRFEDKSYFPFPFNHITQKANALNGSTGIVIMSNQGWRVAVNLATGFRAPNVDDIAKVFESTDGFLIVPNPDLKPEYTYTGEITIDKNCKSTNIYSTVWYTIYNDVLATAPGKFNGADSIEYDGETSAIYTTVNKNEAYLYGFTLGVKSDVTSAFGITSQVTYTYGRIVNDGGNDYPLDHIPPVYGKTAFLFKQKKFNAQFFVLYNGPKNSKDYSDSREDNQIYSADTENGYMPAWYTLNVNAAYSFTKNFALQVGLDNILDQNYRTFASGISAPGRNLSVTLRCSF